MYSGQRLDGELQRLAHAGRRYACGCGYRAADGAQRLNGTGVRVADITAICLTHLDMDHFSRRGRAPSFAQYRNLLPLQLRGRATEYRSG